MPDPRPKIVIVGAGFGGIEAARRLAKSRADVTIIDQQNHHCFQPLLYQVATAALSPADVAWPIRHILRQQANATVLMAEVRGVDTGRRIVRIDFDRGPVRLSRARHRRDPFLFRPRRLGRGGARPQAHRGRDPHPPPHPAGLRARRARPRDEAERERLLTFVIVGGGATGVEMAGAIAEVARQTLAMDFRSIDPRTARIVLIEAGPRVMPTLPENLSDYVRATLAAMGVEVMTRDAGERLRHARRRHSSTAASTPRTIIWAAGVVASPAAHWIAPQHDRAGRVEGRARSIGAAAIPRSS